MKGLILYIVLTLDNGSVVTKPQPLLSFSYSAGNMVVNGQKVKPDNFTFTSGRIKLTYRSIYASGFE